MQNFTFTCESIAIVTKSGSLQGGDAAEVSVGLKLDSPRGIRPKVGLALERSRWVMTIATTGGTYENEAGSGVGKVRRLTPRPEADATTYLVQIYLNPTQFQRIFQLAISGFAITLVELQVDEVEEQGFEVVAWGEEPSAERRVIDFEATWEPRAPDTASEA